MYVNLLPTEIVVRQQVHRLRRLWIIVLSVVSASGAALCIGKHWDVIQSQTCVQQANVRTREAQRLSAEISGWEREIADVQSRLAALDELRTHRRVVTLLGLLGRGVQIAEGQMQLRKVNLQMVPATATDKAVKEAQSVLNNLNDAEAASGGTLLLDGVVDDAQAIPRLIARLREANVFSQVNLKGSATTSGASAKQRQFQVECIF